jgi:hypothetical protein
MNPIIESMNRYAHANRWAVDGGPVRGLSAGQLTFPLVWHQPLALTGKIGRGEGLLTYKFSFLLLDNSGGENKEDIRQRLEQHALGMIRTLENHPRVHDVRLVGCQPVESPLTHYQESALTVSIEADVLFCHPSAHA